MEAVAYSVRFDNWGPVDFQSWPSDRGFVMKTRFEGVRRTDGVVMGFHAYGFVDTDRDCRITHWETHVSRDYDDFLDIAIGIHGPFTGDAADYLAALGATLPKPRLPFPRPSTDSPAEVWQAARSCVRPASTRPRREPLLLHEEIPQLELLRTPRRWPGPPGHHPPCAQAEAAPS